MSGHPDMSLRKLNVIEGLLIFLAANNSNNEKMTGCSAKSTAKPQTGRCAGSAQLQYCKYLTGHLLAQPT